MLFFTVIYDCPYKEFLDEEGVVVEKKFKSQKTHDVIECSYGTVWNQELCTCQYGKSNSLCFYSVQKAFSMSLLFNTDTVAALRMMQCHI